MGDLTSESLLFGDFRLKMVSLLFLGDFRIKAFLSYWVTYSSFVS